MTAPTASSTRHGLLRLAMRTDAVLVGVAGVPFVAAAGWLSSLTGIPVAVNYALGIFFLVYGVVVYWLAGVEHVRPGAIATITANALCTVGFTAVTFADLWPLTGWGIAILLGGAAYTAVFGAVQYAGLRQMQSR